MFNPNAKNESQRELIPEGLHAARCARIIEIGKHYSERHGETPETARDKAVIVLSISDFTRDFGEGPKQAFLSKGYGITISNNERSAMYQYIRALDPYKKATSLGDLLGAACQVYVQHRAPNKDGVVYEDIANIGPIMNPDLVPELDTEPFWFQWENPDPDVYELIPQFQKDRIEQAVNYDGSAVQNMLLSRVLNDA